MIYNYNECIKLYGSHYYLEKALREKRIFKVDNGLYSTNKNSKKLEMFIKKHRKAIFTMESAFYYLGISDVIPDKYVIATNKDATKYKNDSIKQYFMDNNLINIGITTIEYGGITIPLFNKERMLIEIARYKNKIPLDYYKEVINYYRNHLNDIDISLVLEYLETFPKKSLISRIIQSEVL